MPDPAVKPTVDRPGFSTGPSRSTLACPAVDPTSIQMASNDFTAPRFASDKPKRLAFIQSDTPHDHLSCFRGVLPAIPKTRETGRNHPKTRLEFTQTPPPPLNLRQRQKTARKPHPIERSISEPSGVKTMCLSPGAGSLRLGRPWKHSQTLAQPAACICKTLVMNQWIKCDFAGCLTEAKPSVTSCIHWKTSGIL